MFKNELLKFMVTIFFFGDIFGCNIHGILHHRFSNSIGTISSIAGVFPQLSIVSQSSISRSTTSSSWLMYPIISSWYSDFHLRLPTSCSLHCLFDCLFCVFGVLPVNFFKYPGLVIQDNLISFLYVLI